MPEKLPLFIHSLGPWLFWAVLILGVSVLLLIEVEYRQSGKPRRDLWRAVANGIWSGFRSGVRGYFAPFHKAPWLAAWRAYQDPAGRWWSPLAAWTNAIERIAFGKAPSSTRNGERNGPAA
ncbi:hypothetical protein [Dechloromonas denitrificans]|uniref:hypothetical protein n=1 Tax=Dechloromonas denitrificans TaxID=281362 RepID=UPI001CF847E0|nr:hypothetical protein [Dechloromonas denitrificans]UCV03283.1 hypothetical protein KI611_19805 [Dechloromonas denitrificans]